MDLLDLPVKPVTDPDMAPHAPNSHFPKPYQRRETRCILAIEKRFFKGYDESYIASIGGEASQGFSTTFTFVYGSLITPEIRIAHRFLAGSRIENATSVVHFRMTIPINSIGRDITYGHTAVRGHDAFYLRLDLDIEKVVISRTSNTPADAKLAAAGDGCFESLRKKKSTKLNILVPVSHKFIIEELADIFKGSFTGLKSREIVDSELECLLKGTRIEDVDFGKIHEHFPRPEYPIPATMVFHDEWSRVIRLQASSQEEYHREFTKARPLGWLNHRCAMIPDPASRWERNENRQHGFTPDGTYQKYLVVMTVDNDYKSLLPSIEEPCTLHFGDTVRTMIRSEDAPGEGYTTEGWKAFRMSPPRGAPSQFIYFVAAVPRQFDKSSDSETVPVVVFLPPSVANLPIGKLTGRNGERIKMRHQVNIRLSTSPATTQMEMDAVKKMRCAAGGSIRQAMRWAYTQKFSMDGVEHVDIHDAFPGVAKLAVSSNFDAPQIELFNSLRKAPAGIAMYTGGPGSGKSTFAAIIAAAVATHNRDGDRDRVIWTVYSNDLCDDAVRRLQDKCGNKARVGRLPTWTTLIDSLADLRLSKRTPNPKITAKSQRLSKHVGNLFGDNTCGKENTDPKSSVTASAIGIATHNAAFWEDKIGSANWRDTCRVIVSLAISQFHVLVATPYTVGQLGNQINPELMRSGPNECLLWVPSLIVIDEAGRIPEAQWWIPLAAFPDAIVLTMGDTRQFKPMSVSVNAITEQNHEKGSEPLWKCVFGKQRTLSILRRAEMCGQVLGHLSSNRRNRGDIAEWAWKNAYCGENEMQILYPLQDDHARTYARFLQWVFASKVSDTNSVLFDIRRSCSERHGTGYLNEASRNFTLWLIYQAFRYRLPNLTARGKLADVMIITPYSSQAHAYKTDIAGLADSGIIKDKITVRTIDNSMSTEADLVIFDVVRTRDISGFINDRRRMTVASTRARGAAIMVFNATGLMAIRSSEEGDGSFNSYARWNAGPRRVKVDDQDWDFVCKKCNKPDNRMGHDCDTAGSACVICGSGDHHERFCGQGKPAVDEYNVSAEEDAVRWRLCQLF